MGFARRRQGHTKLCGASGMGPAHISASSSDVQHLRFAGTTASLDRALSWLLMPTTAVLIKSQRHHAVLKRRDLDQPRSGLRT